MVVDIGGGTTDIAVLSLGGIVVNRALRLGGDKFDEAIVKFIRREFNLAIGERTGEDIKIEIAGACPDETPHLSMQVRGRDLLHGLPREVTITTQQIYCAISENLSQVVNTIKEVLEETPPELAADIIDKGIVLTGGGALLQNIDMLIARETGLNVIIADDPLSCVAMGTERALAMLSVLHSRPNSRLISSTLKQSMSEA